MKQWAFALCASVLTLGCGESWATEPLSPCDQIISGERVTDEAKADTAIATLTGEAILFPGNPEFGTAAVTKCLFDLYTVYGARLGDIDIVASKALLSLLTADPNGWFDTAVTVDTKTVDFWLAVPLPAAEMQGIGHCSSPDRFEQAMRVLAAYKTKDALTENLKQRVLRALKDVHCYSAT